MAKIEMNVLEVTQVASEIQGAANIAKEAVTKDSTSTVQGNKKASEAIDLLEKIASSIQEAGNSLSTSLSNMALTFEAFDNSIGK